jgi:hypothetical protein
MTMKTPIWMTAALATALLGGAAGATEPPASGEKQIRVRDDVTASKVKLDVKQTKASYKVGEAIRFSARVDRAAYVYVYTRDPDSKYLTLLYPARAADKNRLAAGKWVVVPPKQEFFGDEPGAEKIVVVASAKPIDLNSRYFTEEGKFLRTSSESLSAAFGEKGIKLRDETPTVSADPGQKILSVKIVK